MSLITITLLGKRPKVLLGDTCQRIYRILLEKFIKPQKCHRFPPSRGIIYALEPGVKSSLSLPTLKVLDCPVGMNIRAHPLAGPDLRCDHTEGPRREIALGHVDSEMGRLRAGLRIQ